jgi:AcrR family transcriptional regulator
MTQRDKKFSRDKEAKIEAIIGAFSELIAERGYSRASVRDIPSKADLSIGTVYRYFPKGKIDIVREIMNRNTSRILDLDIPERLDPAAFTKLWSYIIEIATEVRKGGLILAGNVSLTEDVDLESFRDITESVLRFYRWLANRFKELDHLKNCSETELVRRIIVMMQILDGVINRHLKYPIFDDDKELSDYLLRVVDVTFESCA